MPRLVLGPLLRYVDPERATIWVEVDSSCTVEVLGHSMQTIKIHDRYYAVVVVEGLTPGTSTPYEVRLDGEVVWPAADSRLPPSVIRTPDPEHRRTSLSFGSCRLTMPPHVDHSKTHGIDALHALAIEGMRDRAALPDLLFLAGDQVYADEAGPGVAELVVHDVEGPRPPRHEIADYEEYARLYGVAWSEPTVRWLLSTVPSVMIFDDHDVRDDWNTSHAWKQKMRAQPWWRRRIIGAIASYWIYQHVGNLDPDDLATDERWLKTIDAAEDATEVIDTYAAQTADRTEGSRWSYVRDLGRTRLLVVDSRCGRVTEEPRRAMLDPEEWRWVADAARADIDHLLVGSSLPVFLPTPLHDAESWNEAITAGVWGRRWARIGERLRQGLDLEHWASFRRSFDDLVGLFTVIAAGEQHPASIAVLSGDVHFSYAARVALPGAKAHVWQLVCSPIRNPVSGLLKFANAVSVWEPLDGLFRRLSRRAGVPESEAHWDLQRGPWYDNAIATVTIEGRSATVQWRRSVSGQHDPDPALGFDDGLVELGRLALTD